MLRRTVTAPAGATRSFGDILRDVKNNLPNGFTTASLERLRVTEFNTVTTDDMIQVKSELETLVTRLPNQYSGSELNRLNLQIEREINSIDTPLQQAASLRELAATLAADRAAQEAAENVDEVTPTPNEDANAVGASVSTEPYDDYSQYTDNTEESNSLESRSPWGAYQAHQEEYLDLSGDSHTPTDE